MPQAFLWGLGCSAAGTLQLSRAPARARRSRATRRAQPNIGDLLGKMPQMMEGMKKLPELQKKLKDMPSTGTALDGRVKVTLTGDLAPLRVEIDPSVMNSASSEELSAGVLEAMKEAHAASVELTRSSLAEFYGSMGVPVPPSMTGGAPAGAPAPAVSPSAGAAS